MGDKIDIDGAIDMEVSRKIGSRLNIILAHGSKSNMYYSLIQKLFNAFKDNYSVLRFNSTSINAIREGGYSSKIRHCFVPQLTHLHTSNKYRENINHLSLPENAVTGFYDGVHMNNTRAGKECKRTG